MLNNLILFICAWKEQMVVKKKRKKKQYTKYHQYISPAKVERWYRKYVKSIYVLFKQNGWNVRIRNENKN